MTIEINSQLFAAMRELPQQGGYSDILRKRNNFFFQLKSKN